MKCSLNLATPELLRAIWVWETLSSQLPSCCCLQELSVVSFASGTMLRTLASFCHSHILCKTCSGCNVSVQELCGTCQSLAVCLFFSFFFPSPLSFSPFVLIVNIFFYCALFIRVLLLIKLAFLPCCVFLDWCETIGHVFWIMYYISGMPILPNIPASSLQEVSWDM